ncbi:MAG TPA: FtsX-like permease family protein [Puia sp.]|nr:FtsX-like permease family protein [Puia sp.]
MFKNYLKVAWRNIVRHKIFAFINVIGLAVGICACVVIYMVAHFELTFDRFHEDRDHIYRIITDRQDHGEVHISGTVVSALPSLARNSIAGIEALAPYYLYDATISVPGNETRISRFDNKLKDASIASTILTSSEYFKVFGFDWLAGNAATALNEPFKIVLSESKVKKYFGDIAADQAIGRNLIYNDSLSLTITGVVKEWKESTDFPFNEFISLSTAETAQLRNDIHPYSWDGGGVPWNSRVVLKLAGNASELRVNDQLMALVKSHIHAEQSVKYSVLLQKLSDVHFDGKVEDGIPKAHLPTLYVLMGIAVFILLLAVINFINLSTAMSIRRAREIGVRKVLGSSRISLLLQFLLESSLLTFMALAVSLIFVKPVLYMLASFIPKQVGYDFFSITTFGFAIALGLITALLSGVYPARIVASYLPVECFRGNGPRIGNEGWWLRKGLIVFQFSISLIFIISTIVIERQINFMRNEDLGFTTHAILSVDTDSGDTTGKAELLVARLRRLPDVNMVARQSFAPTTDMHTMLPLKYHGKHDMDVVAALQLGDEHFIPLYEMKILAGSNIRRSDSLREFVVNESMCRAIGCDNPRDALGKFLFLGDHGFPISGVVADFHEYSYREAIKPVIMADIEKGGAAEPGIAVRLATPDRKISNMKNVLAQMQREWEAIFPNTPFVYHFVDDSIAAMYEKERKTASLMNAAMSLTIFISCMGLFGLTMFTARQKTKEIGIRKLLGANTLQISFLLSRSFMLLIFLSILIASPIAWYFMHLWLQDFIYRVGIGLPVFIMAGLIAMLVGLLTISFQTLKTAFMNPVDSLRADG